MGPGIADDPNSQALWCAQAICRGEASRSRARSSSCRQGAGLGTPLRANSFCIHLKCLLTLV